MKKTFLSVLVAAIATNLVAQTTPHPKSTPPRKDAALKAALNAAVEAQNAEETAQHSAPEKDVFLVPGPATISGDNVNVRGRASLIGEIVTRLGKGDTVTVLEKITLPAPKKDEPAHWAKIAFPTNAHVWVYASFIDPTSKTVAAKLLNLRAGPGENYSVVGTLQRGDAVTEISHKERWMQIAPPSQAYAFVAAQFLQQSPSATATATAEPAPATPAFATPAPLEPAPATAMETPAPPVEPAAMNPTPAVEPTPVAAEPVAPAAAEPPPKRIVQREGVVRATWNIQSPTAYVLVSPDTGETINYLYTTSTNLNLKRYKGLKIIVTGEEGLDARWTNTPVITIQKIHVVE